MRKHPPILLPPVVPGSDPQDPSAVSRVVPRCAQPENFRSARRKCESGPRRKMLFSATKLAVSLHFFGKVPKRVQLSACAPSSPNSAPGRSLDCLRVPVAALSPSASDTRRKSLPFCEKSGGSSAGVHEKQEGSQPSPKIFFCFFLGARRARSALLRARRVHGPPLGVHARGASAESSPAICARPKHKCSFL